MIQHVEHARFVIYASISKQITSTLNIANWKMKAISIVNRVLFDAEQEFPYIVSQKRSGLDFVIDVTLKHPHLEIGTFAPDMCGWIKERADRMLEKMNTTLQINYSIQETKDREIDFVGLEEQFQTILNTRNVYTVYQPIVSLNDGSVFGFESLLRGPRESQFHSPVQLFQFAEQNGSLYSLDRLAREKAIEGFCLRDEQQRIFINLPANIIHDPNLLPGNTLKLLQTFGLKPENVVFEITERSSIEDFSTVKQTLQYYRNQGYQIAIDDAGAGYSSLQAIAELRPDFVKVDRSLVDNVSKDKAKEYMLETFVHFSRKLNIRLIAEGIEQEEDLYKLIRLGFHYGQGYLLGKPNEELKKTGKSLRCKIINNQAWSDTSFGLPYIKELSEPVKTFDTYTTVEEAADYFNNYDEKHCAVVVDDENYPLGLLMKEKLYQRLSEPYGLPLYSKKSVESIMDAEPLIANGQLSIDKVSQLAMMRDKTKLYDVVVVTDQGRLMGVATVQSILESITNMRMEFAKVANPLTGLPGNLLIEEEINKRLFNNTSFSIIYVDLDHFKWFNDAYGFQQGDDVILNTATVLEQCLQLFDPGNHFIGHIGGDDFLIIVESDRIDALCENIIHRFDQMVDQLMIDKPYFPVEDRFGNRIEDGRLSISLGVIVCNHFGASLKMISNLAAKVKKMAKVEKGSAYKIEQAGVALK